MKKQTPSRLFLAALTAWVMALSFIFVGCSTSLTQGSPKSQRVAAANKLLGQAEHAPPSQAMELRLQAVEHFIQAGDLASAIHILKEIQALEVGMDPEMRKQVLEARLSLTKEDIEAALSSVQRVLAKLPRDLSQTRFGRASGRKIALLLPAKGTHSEAAQTIRDGFLAAYYQARKQEPGGISVQIYDTNGSGGLSQAYSQALADQVDLIVGPLTKPEVEQMASLPHTVPVLALNTISSSGASSQFYQFGLLPEDEITALANQAYRQGHKRAIAIVPQNEWGERMLSVFRSNWEAVGGHIVEKVLLQPKQNWAFKIRSSLRAEDYSMRKDIDMVFLAASPELAREVKPVLAVENQPPIAVYATASVYSGQPQPSKDAALEGVHFCDMPWVLSNATDLQSNRQSLSDLWPGFSKSPRYFALGMDAFHLASLLADNRTIRSGTRGMTGELYLNNKQHVERRLICARFQNGVPILDQ